MEKMKLWLPIAAIIFSVISFALSYRQTLEGARSRIRPVLVFVWENKHWYLYNVGSGTALNVVVAQSNDIKKWIRPIRVAPLTVGGKMYLHWLGSCDIRALGVIYEDFDNRTYTTMTWDDKAHLSLGQTFQWASNLEIKQWWKLTEPISCDGI